MFLINFYCVNIQKYFQQTFELALGINIPKEKSPTKAPCVAPEALIVSWNNNKSTVLIE